MQDTNEFNFEEFDRHAAPTAGDPLVTIQKYGNIGINRAAFEAMGQPQAAKLLYDKEQQVIGIQPIEPDQRNAYALRKQPRAASWVITGIAFAHRYGIPLGEARRYRAEMHGDVLTVDLKQQPV